MRQTPLSVGSQDSWSIGASPRPPHETSGSLSLATEHPGGDAVNDNFEGGFKKFVPVESLIYKNVITKNFSEQGEVQDKRNIDIARGRKFGTYYKPTGMVGTSATATVQYEGPRRPSQTQEPSPASSSSSPMLPSPGTIRPQHSPNVKSPLEPPPPVIPGAPHPQPSPPAVASKGYPSPQGPQPRANLPPPPQFPQVNPISTPGFNPQLSQPPAPMQTTIGGPDSADQMQAKLHRQMSPMKDPASVNLSAQTPQSLSEDQVHSMQQQLHQQMSPIKDNSPKGPRLHPLSPAGLASAGHGPIPQQRPLLPQGPAEMSPLQQLQQRFNTPVDTGLPTHGRSDPRTLSGPQHLQPVVPNMPLLPGAQDPGGHLSTMDPSLRMPPPPLPPAACLVSGDLNQPFHPGPLEQGNPVGNNQAGRLPGVQGLLPTPGRRQYPGNQTSLLGDPPQVSLTQAPPPGYRASADPRLKRHLIQRQLSNEETRRPTESQDRPGGPDFPVTTGQDPTHFATSDAPLLASVLTGQDPRSFPRPGLNPDYGGSGHVTGQGPPAQQPKPGMSSVQQDFRPSFHTDTGQGRPPGSQPSPGYQGRALPPSYPAQPEFDRTPITTGSYRQAPSDPRLLENRTVEQQPPPQFNVQENPIQNLHKSLSVGTSPITTQTTTTIATSGLSMGGSTPSSTQMGSTPLTTPSGGTTLTGGAKPCPTERPIPDPVVMATGSSRVQEQQGLVKLDLKKSSNAVSSTTAVSEASQEQQDEEKAGNLNLVLEKAMEIIEKATMENEKKKRLNTLTLSPFGSKDRLSKEAYSPEDALSSPDPEEDQVIRGFSRLQERSHSRSPSGSSEGQEEENLDDDVVDMIVKRQPLTAKAAREKPVETGSDSMSPSVRHPSGSDTAAQDRTPPKPEQREETESSNSLDKVDHKDSKSGSDGTVLMAAAQPDRNIPSSLVCVDQQAPAKSRASPEGKLTSDTGLSNVSAMARGLGNPVVVLNRLRYPEKPAEKHPAADPDFSQDSPTSPPGISQTTDSEQRDDLTISDTPASPTDSLVIQDTPASPTMSDPGEDELSVENLREAKRSSDSHSGRAEKRLRLDSSYDSSGKMSMKRPKGIGKRRRSSNDHVGGKNDDSLRAGRGLQYGKGTYSSRYVSGVY